MTDKNMFAISPVDGRYAEKLKTLNKFFSEAASIKYRVLVGIEYFIFLSTLKLPGFKIISNQKAKKLRDVYIKINNKNLLSVKEYERITNHDIKAVEYFLKDEIKRLGLENYSEFIHFGLTSQDINNTSIPLLLKDFANEVYFKKITEVINYLNNLSKKWKNVPMLARTHGQPASPTIVGKEILVFSKRLSLQLSYLEKIPFSAKFGGATGGMNAHYFAYPKIDWHKKVKFFVESILGLSRSYPTTQIEHYDELANFLDCVKRINIILLDLDRDFWTYISLEYFKQKITEGQVGSSAMPHKVNPIDFENSEGNLGVANALLTHLSKKLPVSRLQRDLSDSTVLRNLGVCFAHSVLAYDSLLKGLGKLVLNREKIEKDLDDNWIVISEGIQTYLRSIGFRSPYEALKKLTRVSQKIGKEEIWSFIDSLDIEISHKDYLKK